ncbi:MAG: cytochrome c [Chloroflexi bacterium]|nr:cytochrome c [Chloroflexota bacterium]
MSVKRRALVIGILLFIMTSIGGIASRISAHEVWPPLQPKVTAKVKGDQITYLIWLQNKSDGKVQAIDLRFRVPHATKLVETWAGVPNVNRGTFDGRDVSWYHDSVAAGASEGPFVVVVQVDPWNPDHPHGTVSAYAWTQWRGGNAVSDPLVMQNPMTPPATIISDAEEKRGLIHIEYYGTWRNFNDLRDQVANWAQGQDSGRRIALEKIERLEATLHHVPWPTAKLDMAATGMHEGLHPVEDGLKAQNVAATQAALQKVSNAFHDLTHAFYDDWVAGTQGVVGHVMPHIGYVDISANIADLRTQVANWAAGDDLGRRISLEKVDRMGWVIPHIVWPGIMVGSVVELKEALGAVKEGLQAKDVAATQAALAKVSEASHSLTHDFYDRWIAGRRGMKAHAVVHVTYQDIWGNVNDLRDQVANWAKGQDSGRRIGLEKVDRLEALFGHVDWPKEMKHPIGELEEAIHGVEKGLRAQDLAATQGAITKVSEAFHDLTHEFYESIEPRRPAAPPVMPPAAMPAAPEMPGMPAMPPVTARPSLDAALVAQGSALFTSKGCAACHGPAGEGGIGPRLTHWHEADVIQSAVSKGSGIMPPFSLTDTEMRAIIAFVQSLAQ